MEKQEFNYDKVKKAVEDLLIAVGEDPNRPGLKETPRRVAGSIAIVGFEWYIANYNWTIKHQS